MNWENLNYYFESYESDFLKDLFKDSDYPWTPISKLTDHIIGYFKGLNNRGNLPANRKILFNADKSFKEGSYFITETKMLESDFIDVELNICIKAGTMIEAGSTIKNHTIIENNCEIRQGAYLRGFAYIGEQSVVGHTTEVKNSIFSKHVEAGHFAYIGDSIIGSYVNLGAGTKISNLEFRSLDAKKNELFPEIRFQAEKKMISTNLSKFGAIIGDGCETGCNSVLCPFVLLGPKCWVMPNFCALKGFYKKGSILRLQKDNQL